MEFYGKIDTLFERGEDFSVDTSKFRRPEFALLEFWDVSEKVDGTSTVIEFTKTGFEVGGRTAKSNMTNEMTDVMWETANDSLDKAWVVMERHGLEAMIVYGELYGPKIQNGGNYADTLEFRAFDVKAGSVFLSPNQFRDCADELGIEAVPFLGRMDVATIVEACQTGFDSTFAKRPVASEGIIAKSPVELRNNAGKRLMFKLKTIDFKPGRR